jgi:hypothetical protein
MKKYAIFIVLLLAIAVVYVLVRPTKSIDEPLPIVTTPTGDPTFTWQYTYTTSGDFPKTHVALTATYPDSTTIKKDIDTPDGSCNEYASPDKDIYPRSTMIICYAAGLGHYYKVVQSNNAYLVQRKTFEEGSPQYTPPELPFETIARF